MKTDIINVLRLSEEELFKEVNGNPNGFSQKKAEENLEKYGPNEITKAKRKHPLIGFVNVLINPFNMVLLVVIIITFINDILIETQKDYLTITILLFVVLASTLVSFIQDERSTAAGEKLLDMVSNTTAVLRDGQFIETPIDEIVLGDIIRLSAGDIIPADLRIIFAKDLFLSQATLTGESLPIEKLALLNEDELEQETDYTNLSLMGTNVVSGAGRGVVIRRGDDTYLGNMAKSLEEIETSNSFENSISIISKLLLKLMLIMLPIIFIINGVLKKDFVEAFIFALTVAVGLTPEMLPVALTSSLSSGALNMAKHKTIIKSQSSISTFGEMDILCTDKTGTITKDEIILEKYMDVKGNDDIRVLRHAYLNAYFQSGLKNLIDLAIINRAESYEMNNILSDYHVVDEIPFDFARRRMSVILEDKKGKRQLITKGAVEEILENTKYIDHKGKISLLDDKTRQEALDVYNKHNDDGLRMIAVAQKNDIPVEHEFGIEDENNLVLIGFIGFLDPPKESAKPTIESLHNHGVEVVVISGDSLGVAKKVCSKVGIDTTVTYLGSDVESMSDEELENIVHTCKLFAKVSPTQKQRIIKAFQNKNHIVGYLGDGINDALALQQADVGISVDTAVDIAKESANIILLDKDLRVLEEGILEGRKTIVNMIKYLELAVSGNFGNMISVIVASIFLPFLPLLPVHILVQNLLSDLAQIGIPFDNVDEEDLLRPKRLSSDSLVKFMRIFGPVSSIFDIICFLVLWFVLGINTVEQAVYFQVFWFAFGIISQSLVIFIIRTRKPLSIKNKPSKMLVATSLFTVIATILIVTTNFAYIVDLVPMQQMHLLLVLVIVALYIFSTTLIKKLVWKY